MVDMERTGVFVDVDFCNKTAELAATDEADAWVRLAPWFDGGGTKVEDALGYPWLMRRDDSDLFNSRTGESPQVIQQFLHGDGGLGLTPSPFWKKGRVKRGKLKTDAAALEYLAGQNPLHREMLLEIIKLRRARGCLKYLRKLPLFVAPHTGRVHAVFGPSSDEDERVGAITGRLGIKKPELMQIPRDPKKDKYGLRNAFVAQYDTDTLLAVDYAALEVIVLAHICKRLFDSDLLVDRTRRGAPDIHSATAAYVYGNILGNPAYAGVDIGAIKKHPELGRDRDTIKTIRYGLNYGKAEWGFGSTIFDAAGNPLGDARAKEMINGLFSFDPDIPRYQDFIWDWIMEKEYIVSLAGRASDLRYLVRGDDWAKKKAWRQALNFPMQAGGAEIMGRAMYLCLVDPILRALGFHAILQIHDELVLEGPERNKAEALARVIHLFETAWQLESDLQATGHTARRWGGCKG